MNGSAEESGRITDSGLTAPNEVFGSLWKILRLPSRHLGLRVRNALVKVVESGIGATINKRVRLFQKKNQPMKHMKATKQSDAYHAAISVHPKPMTPPPLSCPPQSPSQCPFG